MKALLNRIFRRISARNTARDCSSPELLRARQLITAIDAGGIPLDPSIITRIAENLGLEVSRKAQTTDTIERIRAALKRC